VLGLLATPILVVNAVSPTLFAMIVDAWGWRVAQIVLVAVAAASFLAMEAMSAWYERRRRSDSDRALRV
jgi:sugar phosphate permease